MRKVEQEVGLQLNVLHSEQRLLEQVHANLMYSGN